MAKKTITFTKEEYDRAVEAGRWADETEPRGISARYDQASDRVIVELRNGATFMFPPRLLQGMGDATSEQIAQVEVSPSGDALYWRNIDQHYGLPALMMGIFGGKTWMEQLRREMSRDAGRIGGLATTEAKRQTARENGAKGGRPRKAG